MYHIDDLIGHWELNVASHKDPNDFWAVSNTEDFRITRYLRWSDIYLSEYIGVSMPIFVTIKVSKLN